MRRFLPALLLVLCAVPRPALAQTPPPAAEDGRPIIAPTEWLPISELLAGFFRSLTEVGGESSGKKALKTLGPRLVMAEPDREALARKIDETMRVTGRPQEFELIGARSLPRGDRYYSLAYLTHGNAPLLWEAMVYRRRTQWVVLDLELVSEGIFERAREYR